MGTKEVLIMSVPVLLLVIFLVAVVVQDRRAHPEKTPRQPKYDERQSAEQARIYRWAFWTVIVYLLLWFFAEAVLQRRLWEGGFGAFLGFALGVGVFLIACAFRDALVRVGYKGFWMVVVINNLNLFNMINMARSKPSEALISGGVLTMEAAVWLLPLLVLEFDMAALIYYLRERRTRKEE